MQRRIAYILALVAIIALGTGWYFSNQDTSELQSHHDLVCRPLLEKKK